MVDKEQLGTLEERIRTLWAQLSANGGDEIDDLLEALAEAVMDEDGADSQVAVTLAFVAEAKLQHHKLCVSLSCAFDVLQ